MLTVINNVYERYSYFCGQEYGGLMLSAQKAMELMKNTERITLERSYSAKALAALAADSANNTIDEHAVVLLWDTYCGLDFSAATKQISYTQLPQEVHRYFESDASQDI